MPADLPIWARESHPFTWVHLISLIWTLGPLIISCILARRWLARGRADLEHRLAAAWGGFLICINIWSIVFWHLPGTFELAESLPLQLCDIACLLAPLVFLTDWRWPRTLLFFWGIGLSTQAFVTPTVEEGPAHMKYYLFWLVHLGIVGSAIYDVVVRRYRPTFRDLALAVAATIAYALVMVVLNHFLSAHLGHPVNYGFVGDTLRERPTIADKLGPWPRRVFIMAAIVIGLFTFMWLITGAIHRLAGNRRPPRRLLHCGKCGFDLTDISHRSDHCPECGTPVTPPGV